jgi:outer membrane lipoprotein SlyB
MPSNPTIERTFMHRQFRMGIFASMAFTLCGLLMTGCAPSYSPNTYAAAAAQQANKVDQGVVVGVRAVQISADTTLGTGTGAAAGGVLGSTVGGGTTSAIGAVGGTVAGGVVGNVIGHAAGDTDGFEYIVKKDNGDLLSVTQKDVAPLGVGAHVLIIEGAQARIVPDYTVPVMVEAQHPEAAKPAATAATAPATSSPPAIATPPAATPPAAAPAVVASPLPAPVAAQPAGDQKAAATPETAPQPPAKPDETPSPKPSGS